MDHYFVKLMLDQVKKGNKINNIFRRQAWTDMLTLFNMKFSSQYGQKVLKHRYKKLFKYYTNLSSILEVQGFFWDEKQQTIVADAVVWDNYIKAHPDACSYQKKPLLNYLDLGLIYGNAMTNGVSRRSQREKAFKDDIFQLETGEEGEGHFAGDGHLAYSDDPDNEDPDLLIYGEEIQSDLNDDCSSIDWTPSMDRCLIDIMLEQVHKINKIDHSIDDQAWIDIVALFKDRFGLQFHKDVLRSRSKRLEKQYFDMKDLLEQRGFWWDEMQQMITACDDVWDTYIEEYHGAKSYRTKSKPNYNDMCLIYGDSTANGRCNQAGQYLSCNGAGAKLTNSYRWRTDWTPLMDRYFIDLMLEQVRNGSMLNHKFSKLAWTDMVAKFSAEFGFQYDKDVLKSRFLNLRRRFNDMKSLLDQNGFTWDEMQQTIAAAADLWDAYVKEYPDVKSYRNRTLPNINDLYLIFGDASTIEKDSYSSYSVDAEDDDLEVNIGEEDVQSPANISPPRVSVEEDPDAVSYRDGILDSYDELCAAFGYEVPNGRSHVSIKRGMENNIPTMGMGMDDIFCDLQSPAREFEISDQRKKRKSLTSSKSECSKKVQRIIKEEMEETFDEKPGLERWLVSRGEENDHCSIERVVAALETVPDMNGELFLEACELLEDERKAKMFVALDVTARKKWLLRKLRR
ncbi:Myb/SANT-like domain containing protein [Parasponia andersonii]|uniref:Myb/SANT-like domain containing protein n=1 Tax=Parasponia andersonii TaxID=3476 RepID=A0A2P5CU31_PARAD|nr:Myb/SANT-like domain containing protein [Parasponia andersonii]